MPLLYFITHPDVEIKPEQLIRRWGLSASGKEKASQLAQLPWMSSITSMYASTEVKAMETAQIISSTIHVLMSFDESLSEMDRDSTGYLPLEEFEVAVQDFFSTPDSSVRGWETARAAQKRIVDALRTITNSAIAGNIAVVSHGGVGALVLSHYLGHPISQQYDQPKNGGGNYFVVDREKERILSEWMSLQS